MPNEIVYQHTIVSPKQIGRPPSESRPVLQPNDLEDAYARLKDRAKSIKINVSDVDREEIVTLYNATVTDGRYIREFATDPKSVAEKLHLSLSNSAADAIKQTGDALGFGVDPQFFPIPIAIVAVAIIIIFIVVQLPRSIQQGEPIVIDSSGLVKL